MSKNKPKPSTMKAIAIGLLIVVLYFVATRSSGPEIQFIGWEDPTEVSEDFFSSDHECLLVGDTINVLVNPYRRINDSWDYLLMGKYVPPVQPTVCNRTALFFVGYYSDPLDPVRRAVIIRKS